MKKRRPAVVVNVSRPVAQDILASKFRPDFTGQISQFAQICGLEKVSAGHLGEFGKQAGAFAFLAGAFHVARIKNSQRIKLTVRFLQKPANLWQMMPAVIVAAIGEDEQDMPFMTRAPQLLHAQVNRVEKGGPAVRLQ